MYQASCKASNPSRNCSKTSKVKKPKVSSYKSQDSPQSEASQPTGNPGPSTVEPRTYSLDLCPLPPETLLSAESLLPLPIPQATEICILSDSSAMFQLINQPQVSGQSLNPTQGPPRKLPSALAKEQKVKSQHRSKEKQDKEMPCFHIDLVLCDPDMLGLDTPSHLPIPEATEVTFLENHVSPCHSINA